MPFKSQAQRRLMYTATVGKSEKVQPEIAKKFITESKGQNFKRLKEKLFKKKDK